MTRRSTDPSGPDPAGGLGEPDPLPRGTVRRQGGWAVGNAGGSDFAVSRRCRHQLGDLAAGRIDQDGCLVCPWHGSRYDVSSGAMVSGPRGFLGWHGPTPGYTSVVLAYGRRLRLRVGTVRRRGAHLDIT
jgi:nitrite reductase/ring-hydroxylating ferredoxin subunit